MIEWIEARQPLTSWEQAGRRSAPPWRTAQLVVDEWLDLLDGRCMAVNGRTGGWVVVDAAGREDLDRATHHGADNGLVEALWRRGVVALDGRSALDDLDVAGAVEATRQHYTLVLLTSTGCNLACTYCYLGHRLPTPEVSMPTDTALAAIEAALDQPWDSLMLDLGEISVSGPRFETLARSARRLAEQAGKSLRIAVQTNATTIDPRLAALLAELDAVVGVSLDGPAALHDRARVYRSGAGSHDRVMTGLRALRDAGVPFHLIATVARHNITNPREVVDELVAQEPMSFLLKPVLVEGAAGAAWDREGVTAEEYGQFLERSVDGAVELGDGRRLDQTVSKFLARMIGDRNGWRESCTSRACGSGRSMHVIDPSGRSHSCPRFVDGAPATAAPVQFLGRAGRQPAPAVPDLSDLLPETLRVPPPTCDGCPWLSSCGGGCTLSGHDATQPAVPMPDPHCTAYDLTHRRIAARLIPAFLDGALCTATAFNGATVTRMATGSRA